MNKRKTELFCISLFVIGVFLLSYFYSQGMFSSESQREQKETIVTEISDGVEIFCRQIILRQLKTVSLPDSIQLKKSTLKCLNKILQSGVQCTYMTMILLTSGVLYRKGKGRLFVCFITFVYHKARFLYEICIRKKKDGKKWALAF